MPLGDLGEMINAHSSIPHLMDEISKINVLRVDIRESVL